ncbi:hypothetical protein JL720_7854 [Aureococcus anophagefferens]|nr:hypothetical protein JL720_7854 [Aureococcus anophagefferens]
MGSLIVLLLALAGADASQQWRVSGGDGPQETVRVDGLEAARAAAAARAETIVAVAPSASGDAYAASGAAAAVDRFLTTRLEYALARALRRGGAVELRYEASAAELAAAWRRPSSARVLRRRRDDGPARVLGATVGKYGHVGLDALRRGYTIQHPLTIDKWYMAQGSDGFCGDERGASSASSSWNRCPTRATVERLDGEAARRGDAEAADGDDARAAERVQRPPPPPDWAAGRRGDGPRARTFGGAFVRDWITAYADHCMATLDAPSLIQLSHARKLFREEDAAAKKDRPGSPNYRKKTLGNRRYLEATERQTPEILLRPRPVNQRVLASETAVVRAGAMDYADQARKMNDQLLLAEPRSSSATATGGSARTSRRRHLAAPGLALPSTGFAPDDAYDPDAPPVYDIARAFANHDGAAVKHLVPRTQMTYAEYTGTGYGDYGDYAP